MKLTDVHIHHYKSLSSVTLNLHPQVTVLVGPNAAGKSNFVDALRFLRDAAKDSLDHAVVARGGLTRIRQSSTGRPFNIGLGIEVLQSFDDHEDQPGSYSLDIASTGGNYRVEREEVISHSEDYQHTDDEDGGTGEWVLVTNNFLRERSGIVKDNDLERLTLPEEMHDQLALGTTSDTFFFRARGELVHAFIERWKFSSLYPNTLRNLTTPDADGALREDGSNWASVIRAARRTAKGKKMLERVNEMMRVVLPDFNEVSVTTAGSYLVPNFKFGNDKSNTRTFDPVQLSDGTLRIFGILLSLYQNPAPPLIVVEEPEQTVQPGVLGMLAEAFKEVSENTQIIITTHSPQLIEHFAPENIRVVTMKDGLTHIAPIKKSQQDAVRDGLMGLGEFMSAEGLQPELL